VRKDEEGTMQPLNLEHKLITFDKIMNDPPPPVDWLVEPLIVHGSRTIVYGRSASLKTWSAIDLGLHIAGGKAWLGTYKIKQPRSVLYLDEEMGENMLCLRARQLALGCELAAKNISFRSLSYVGRRFSEDYVSTFLDNLKQAGFDPDVVIVDSLRRVLLGSENDAEHVGRFWANVLPLASSRKTIVILHHMKKGNPNVTQDPWDMASGSTDIIAGADIAYAFTRKGQTSPVVIQCTKNRYAKEADPFMINLESEPLSAGEACQPMRICLVEGGNTENEYVNADERATSLVCELVNKGTEILTPKEIKNCIKEMGQSIPDRTVDEAIRMGVLRGSIQKLSLGKYTGRSSMEKAA
jgi:hypothetical protein